MPNGSRSVACKDLRHGRYGRQAVVAGMWIGVTQTSADPRRLVRVMPSFLWAAWIAGQQSGAVSRLRTVSAVDKAY